MGDARIAIEEVLGESVGSVPVDESRELRGAILYLVAGVAAILGAGLTWLLMSTSASPPAAVTRSVLPLAPAEELALMQTSSVAISPDGRSVAYVGNRGGTRELYLRRLEELEAEPIEGTEGARMPFFSPDGQWVGFKTGDELMKVSLRGGGPSPLPGSAVRFVARAGAMTELLFSPIQPWSAYPGFQPTEDRARR